MSRTYRITLKRVVSQEITAADSSKTQLDLDTGLATEQTDELLGAVLERRGWTKVADGVYEKPCGDDKKMTCNTHEREVVTTVQIDRTITEEHRETMLVDSYDWKRLEERSEAEVQREIEQKRAAAGIDNTIGASKRRDEQRKAQAEATHSLEEGADDRRREINAIVLETTAEALKERARSLGEIQSVEEQWSGEDYDLTLTIRE